MEKSFYRTDFLFPSVSFLESIGSICSIFNFYFEYNTSENASIADLNSLESDFGVIGKDLESSMQSYVK